ncbi:hypothetical protein [Chromobacterium violaceum]|uniref:hypothetical protein n=1 Tax=Chromobacterium violaceum TaxID=536 RepID=UPI001CE07950|nr:hypothetical protein [Chromobacterium violaceum]
MKKKEIEKLILESFTNSKYKWRTARGVSKETKIPVNDVTVFLEKSSNFERSKKTNSTGQRLYMYKGTLIDRIKSAILNRPE